MCSLRGAVSANPNPKLLNPNLKSDTLTLNPYRTNPKPLPYYTIAAILNIFLACGFGDSPLLQRAAIANVAIAM